MGLPYHFNMSLIQKINFKKIVLILLLATFTLELLNIGFESSWDNYFSVNSSNQSINYPLYFFQSVIYGLHYYTGGWILVYALAIVAVMYNVLPFKLESIKEKFILLAFVFGYLVLHTAVFSGERPGMMMGAGLYHVIMKFLGLGGLVFCIVGLNLFLIYFFLMRFNFFKPKMDLLLKQKVDAPIYSFGSNQINVTTSSSHEAHDVKKAFTPEPKYQMSLKLEDTNEDELIEDDENNEEELLLDQDQQIVKEKKVLRSSDRSDEENKRLLSQYINETSSQLESSSPDAEYFQGIKKILEEKLAEFKITGTIINVMKGPVVDTFELELGAGVKVSRVASASEDLSLALSGAPIRIVFPLKGKSTVGIEVPRSPREIIYLTELLKSNEFLNNRLRIPLVLGKNAFGEPVVEDLAAMPHMLVAGATGAGKSVFINSVLVSLLVRLDHHKLKLILIDPKQLELSLYARLKHLLLPVMTTPSLASCALLWATEEMERRYSLMSQSGVRNIDGYNAKVQGGSIDGEVLPYIVVVVDEFADLILSKHGKDIETNICRLAAKARASGIHLLLATQRPSVDVITGLIKSNFPTRVSFRVTSSIDSRTILNATGAENLLGMGDMLYKTGVETFRVHSPYIHEDEIDKIVSYLSSDAPSFDPGVMEFIEEKEQEISGSTNVKGANEGELGASVEEEDSLLGQAIEIVMQYKAASASMLQRRLKIGYNRAANLVEIMEKKGIVGPQQGAKPRRVIIQDLPQD
jgi:S-DNA-T family DNA segregation ATPase FtsK/SpoIIIE